MKKVFSFKKFVENFFGVTKHYDHLYNALKDGGFWAANHDGEEVIDNIIDDLIIHDDWCEVVYE